MIWFHLYHTSSARDVGTLYQARNAINARNVTKDPTNNYYAASELLDKFLDAYLIVGALTHFGMASVDGQPSVNHYEGPPNDLQYKKAYVEGTVRSFVEKHVINQMPEMIPDAPTSDELVCQYCGKKYQRPTYFKKHQEKEHGHVSEDSPETVCKSKEDMVYNYTHNVLVLLLLRANHNDAIHLGDGKQVVGLYKFFYLFYKISNCPKYAFATLELLAQLSCLLTPRMSYSLTWNCFVNHKGKVDSNHPMDLDLEHDNKYFKNDIHSYRGEITDRSIDRVSRSVESTNAILDSYDNNTAVRRPSGRHTRRSTEEDVMLLVEHLQEADVYSSIPGRFHLAFPKMKHNLFEAMDMGRLKSWISNSIKKFSKKNYYKLL